jgi:aminoglycoside phosphotransferase family enzyme
MQPAQSILLGLYVCPSPYANFYLQCYLNFYTMLMMVMIASYSMPLLRVRAVRCKICILSLYSSYCWIGSSRLLKLHKPEKRTQDSSFSQSFSVKAYRTSESALLYFGSMPGSDDNTVLKVLLPRQDSRLDLTSPSSRRACQVEGLRWNTYFTEDVYLGLVSLPAQDFKPNLKSISIGSLIPSVEEAERRHERDLTSEYGLLMRALPDDRRLDCVLQTTNGEALDLVLERLVKRISHIHNTRQSSLKEARHSVPSDPPPGSYEQIKQKLEHNLDFLSAVIDRDKARYGQLCRSLIEGLHVIINDPLYKNYFSSRLDHHFVKRCHGDLKAPNIWIMEDSEQIYDYGVKILDAIDFNNSYCTIDVLSDFAMLVVDVELRTQAEAHEDRMIKEYLRLTDQSNDDAAYPLLSYYLVEKAMINAIVNILYDQQPDLGLKFLHLAKLRMEKLLGL